MKTGQDEIFTLDELAIYLTVGKRTLYRLAAHGEIPVFKVGGTWLFHHSEIDRWIAGQTDDGAKKEVRQRREQQKSAKSAMSPVRDVRCNRRMV